MPETMLDPRVTALPAQSAFAQRPASAIRGGGGLRPHTGVRFRQRLSRRTLAAAVGKLPGTHWRGPGRTTPCTVMRVAPQQYVVRG
jgi:hypothetical protein